MRLLNLTAVAGIAVNLLVNVILIPRLHACGAAVASLATQSVMALIQTVIAIRVTQLPLKEIPILKILIFTAILIPSCYLFSTYFHGKTIVALLISGGFACLLGLVTRLIPLDAVNELRINQK